MRVLNIVAALAFIVMSATTAEAYAIYSHSDYDCLVCTPFQRSMALPCDFDVEAGDTHNGAPGSGLNDVYFLLTVSNNCTKSNTVTITIPDGGYARIYNDTVKVWNHDGDYLGGYPFEVYKGDCP